MLFFVSFIITAALTFLLSFAAAKPHARPHRFIRAVSSGQATYLSAHNDVRAAHGASPLTWSDTLATKAQQWANGCQFRHSDGALGPEIYGENLAAGVGQFSATTAVQIFTDDASEYSASDPTYNHFTQVVWKSTTQVGCAVAQCGGIFDPSYGEASYHVCLYDPAGNVVGEALANVQI